MYRLILIVMLLLLVACNDKQINFVLNANETIDLVAGGNFEQIQPSDNRYEQLRHWLKKNENGWSQIYSTPPGGGVLVRGQSLHLQFFGKTAYASSSDGVVHKQVKESEYAFLIAPNGT